MAPFDPHKVTLRSYYPERFAIDCSRCRRYAPVDRVDMLHRFGDVTLTAVAQKVAARAGCALAGDGCGARAIELAVEAWARLSNAKSQNWGGVLFCHRHLDALKRAHSCPEAVSLDVLSLITVLGDDYPLASLPGRCSCPRCGTHSIEIVWRTHNSPVTPGGASADPPQNVLRLKDRRHIAGRTRLKVIGD